jgi:hypothetical protein
MLFYWLNSTNKKCLKLSVFVALSRSRILIDWLTDHRVIVRHIDVQQNTELIN